MVTPPSDMPSSRQVEFNGDSRITKSVSGLSERRKPASSMLLPTYDSRGGVCQREVRESTGERYLG